MGGVMARPLLMADAPLKIVATVMMLLLRKNAIARKSKGWDFRTDTLATALK
jgi:hypothetical protein